MNKIRIAPSRAILSLTSCGNNAQTTMKESKILVAYFSWSNNTKAVAEHIAGKTGADLFRIERVKPYPAEYGPCTEDAKSEKEASERPEIKGSLENFAAVCATTDCGILMNFADGANTVTT